jgi:hypothetical protein
MHESGKALITALPSGDHTLVLVQLGQPALDF